MYLRRATDVSLGMPGKDWKSETAALINYYSTLFTEQNRLMRLLEKGFRLGEKSEALLDLTNETMWDEPAADTAPIQLRFTMPIKDPSMAVVRAVAIPFYNRTQRVDKNICWMTYKGPKHILVNKTNDCMTDTIHWAERDEAIRSQTCTDKDDQLHNLGSMYSADSCSTEA